MDIRPIRTEADYDWALGEVEQYFDTEPARGTPDADRFDVLTDLITAYEARYWPIEAPDPITTIKTFMAERHVPRSELGRLFGSNPRASEVLNRKRALTMQMAYKLHTEWKLPAEVLIQPYALER